MSKFALLKIDTVKGDRKFSKLEIDGYCEFDDYEVNVRVNYDSQMNSIYHRMDSLSRGEKLPPKQFRILKGGLKNVTECEIKTDNLRVYYYIDKKDGNIIIIGGYKKGQEKDINRFRGIIKRYHETKKEIK